MQRALIVAAVLLIVLAGVGVAGLLLSRPAAAPIEVLPPASPSPAPPPSPSATPGLLHVDVAGAVLHPGVYMLPPGSLVADAIAAAGGPDAEADLDGVNKAVYVQDEMQVTVPRKGQALAAPAVTTVSAPAKGATTPTRVNLNTASLDALASLPGIGSALAERIVAARPYATVEDVMRVPGIKEATFEKLKPYVSVR